LDAQTIRLEGSIGSRTIGVIIHRHAGPGCTGAWTEKPFSADFSGVKALFPMLGAAVLACELAGQPWPAIDLAKLKLHATGKGHAGKPETQAAAKATGMSIRINAHRGVPVRRPGCRPASRSQSLPGFNQSPRAG
jgi:hypothetical protein